MNNLDIPDEFMISSIINLAFVKVFSLFISRYNFFFLEKILFWHVQSYYAIFHILFVVISSSRLNGLKDLARTEAHIFYLYVDHKKKHKIKHNNKNQKQITNKQSKQTNKQTKTNKNNKTITPSPQKKHKNKQNNKTLRKQPPKNKENFKKAKRKKQ